ncbi:MAG: protein kinase [Pseudomonadota bacterium]|nr:protein kinase [Pseudomonadota bacterium]
MASRESSRRFHFIKEIASGGFGSVYLAKVMHADGFSRLAAIKLLHQRWSENIEIAQRMRDEARLLGWLRHRNIVDVIDLTTIGGRVAVIMEYLEAIDFKGAINQTIESGETMPPRVALEATAFVASALDAAYNRPPYQGEKPLRVIHRDIKPSNIMVDESGTVKVLDFGVARADFDHRESHTQELQFGSVDYMPPERLFFEPETPFSDVYSLGATLYELLALEKLGKAKGRPEKHAQFLVDRLAFLRTRCELPGISGDAVIELIQQMCAYGHEGRPSAAETVTRCRALARGFEGEGLGEWAERVLPPLLKASREEPREPNPLTDSILSEDSASFKADDTYVDSVEDGGIVIRAEDPVPAAIPPSDERWDLLRQAALSEIQARGDVEVTDLGNVRQDDEVEVIDEVAEAAYAAAPAAPARGAAAAHLTGVANVGNLLDAPSAAYLKTMRSHGGSPGQSAAPPVPPPPPPVVARPAAQTVASKPAAPAGVASPAATAALRPNATMIPDFEDEHAPTQAFRVPPRVEPMSADATVQGIPAGTLPPTSPASDPPRSPLVGARPAEPAPAARPAEVAPLIPAAPVLQAASVASPPVEVERPRKPARPAVAPVDTFDEPVPKGRSWLLPALLVFGLLGLVGVAGVVLVGGMYLGGSSGASVTTTTPPSPSPDAQAAAATMAGTSAAPASVPGGLTFISRAPDTAKITVSCDGVEVTGADSVGLAATSATTCSVKVMLKDRTRLYGEVSGATAGTYTCFEGGTSGTKECVR